jgi:hypothetical protein
MSVFFLYPFSGTALGDFLFPEDSSAKLQSVLTLLISTTVE